MATVTMKELLEAGVHFGHQVKRWNPKMKEYIFGERNGIYIIDLQKTQRLFKEAVKFVTQRAFEGRTFLFVGTKRQAQDAVEEEAKRCNQFFVNNRWLGGLLTNFQTVQKSIQRLKDIEAMRTDGRYDQLTKKECLRLDREHAALEKNLAGIRDMNRLPDVVFIIDSNKEEIAVREANKLTIPVVAIVDTNCNPDGIDYIVPGNDDALRAVRLFAQKMADAIIEGQQMAKEGAAEITEAEPAEAGAASTPAEEPRADKRPAGPGGRPSRDRRGRQGRRTSYVPPGAPPIPETAVAVSPTSVDAGEASQAESNGSRQAETGLASATAASHDPAAAIEPSAASSAMPAEVGEEKE